jgi:hypothetical protein
MEIWFSVMVFGNPPTLINLTLDFHDDGVNDLVEDLFT